MMVNLYIMPIFMPLSPCFLTIVLVYIWVESFDCIGAQLIDSFDCIGAHWEWDWLYWCVVDWKFWLYWCIFGSKVLIVLVTFTFRSFHSNAYRPRSLRSLPIIEYHSLRSFYYSFTSFILLFIHFVHS